MSHLFRRIQNNTRAEGLEKIVIWIDNRLKRFAIYLEHKTQHVQPRRMAILMIVPCLFFSFCLGLVMFRTTTNINDIHVPAIRAPLIKTYRRSPMNDVLLQRIRHFHHELDSLRQNNVSRYDSLMKSRPRLLDSILTIEQLSNE